MSKKTRFHCERLEDRQLLAADLASVELFEVRDLDDSPISSLATVFVDQNGDATLEIDLEDRKVPTINVFHVDDVEINGDGSAASPFNDIGTALTSLQGTVTTATLLVEPGLYTWGSLNEIGYNFNIIGSGTGSDPSAATIVTHVPEADPDNTFAAQFRVSRAYMEGITFDGNFTSGSVVDIRNAAALTIVDSEFKNAGAGDGINIINTAEVVVVGSTAHNNFSDGFSYTTGANPEAYMEVLEADVHSYANGQNGEWNSQGSTVHKNVDIVRVSSLY